MIDFLNEYPLDEPLIFDSHAHYNDDRLLEVENELLSSLPKSGVKGLITCGCEPVSNKSACNLAEKYDYIYFAAGIHPGNIDCTEKQPLEEILREIEAYQSHPKCVGIGEIGLDYYWTQDNIDLQKNVFKSQLELANASSKPVIVHDRDAHADTLEMLKKYTPKGVVHSFSGSVEMSREIFKLGMYIGISGVITFKNAKKLPDVVKEMPLDRFLLETDAPYLAPVPFRGKLNHSAMIYYSAKRIGEIRGITTEDVLKYALENTEKLYFK